MLPAQRIEHKRRKCGSSFLLCSATPKRKSVLDMKVILVIHEKYEDYSKCTFLLTRDYKHLDHSCSLNIGCHHGLNQVTLRTRKFTYMGCLAPVWALIFYAAEPNQILDVFSLNRGSSATAKRPAHIQQEWVVNLKHAHKSQQAKGFEKLDDNTLWYCQNK